MRSRLRPCLALPCLPPATESRRSKRQGRSLTCSTTAAPWPTFGENGPTSPTRRAHPSSLATRVADPPCHPTPIHLSVPCGCFFYRRWRAAWEDGDNTSELMGLGALASFLALHFFMLSIRKCETPLTPPSCPDRGPLAQPTMPLPWWWRAQVCRRTTGIQAHSCGKSDPLHRHVPVGRLPAGDQGRL